MQKLTRAADSRAYLVGELLNVLDVLSQQSFCASLITLLQLYFVVRCRSCREELQ